jgi:hypothetical protein
VAGEHTFTFADGVLSQYCLGQIPVDRAQIAQTMVFKVVGAVCFVVGHVFSFAYKHSITNLVVIRIVSITRVTIGSGATDD